MIKPIVTNKKELHYVCESVLVTDSSEFVSDLRDTAASLNNCAGLAAPQIGHMVRVILVKVQGKAIIMINPEYIERKGKLISGNEGCFSVPGSITKPIRVKRYNKIYIEYVDDNAVRKIARFKSFEARLIQHEVDHLDGVLIGDK